MVIVAEVGAVVLSGELKVCPIFCRSRHHLKITVPQCFKPKAWWDELSDILLNNL
jgi:hypothetical protein